MKTAIVDELQQLLESEPKSSDIRARTSRLALVVKEIGAPLDAQIFKRLEQKWSGAVSADDWAYLVIWDRPPTELMLDLVCKERPDKAAWIMTGNSHTEVKALAVSAPQPAALAAPPEALQAFQLGSMVEDLRERLVFLATVLAPSRARYEFLARKTGIAATKWKNLFIGRQLPTNEMLLAVCAACPLYAHWLMTENRAGEGHAPAPEIWAKFQADRNWKQSRRRELVSGDSVSGEL